MGGKCSASERLVSGLGDTGHHSPGRTAVPPHLVKKLEEAAGGRNLQKEFPGFAHVSSLCFSDSVPFKVGITHLFRNITGVAVKMARLLGESSYTAESSWNSPKRTDISWRFCTLGLGSWVGVENGELLQVLFCFVSKKGTSYL